MTFVLADQVRQSTLTTGLGPYQLSFVPGYREFGDVMEIGDTTWGTIKIPGGAFLSGLFTYTDNDEITVTEVFESSNSNDPVNFGVGTKDIFIGLPASKSQAFSPGTRLTFNQTTAPVGWTKSVMHNDAVFRVVSGAASSGGTNAFTTVMAQTTVGSTTLSNAQVPSHTHTGSGTTSGQSNDHTHLYNTAGNKSGLGPASGIAILWASNLGNPDVSSGGASADHSHNYSFTTSSSGGGGSHNHSIAMDIRYVDLIIAQKD